MLDKVLAKARRGDDKKVNINFQTTSTLKEEFDKVCKETGVSITAMLNSLMEVIVEEHQGINIDDYDILRLLELQEKYMNDLRWFRENRSKLNEEQFEEMAAIETSLNAIRKKLQRGEDNESNH